jgi:hypothetical protein
MKAYLSAAAVIAALGVLLGQTGFQAEANQCVSQCRAAHNQCRMATKGSPSCDSQLQSCMDRCRSSR